MTGIDASKEMIGQAVRNARFAGVQVDFFVQDMRRIKLNQVSDCALSIFGSFARLMDQVDFKKFFEGLYQYLKIQRPFHLRLHKYGWGHTRS